MDRTYRTITGFKLRLAERIRAQDPRLSEELRNVKLPWYAIRNVADDDGDSAAAELLIYDEIGGSFGISSDEFVKDLMGIKAKNIDVRINSPGGSVFDAIAIYNALIKHPANVTTYVDALAASAASIIAMAGDSVVMMVGSQLMIHDALGLEMGNAKDMREMANFLDRQSDNLATIYSAKGGDTSDWRALMLKETWMFADEAVELGLADSVYTRTLKREKAEELEEGPEDALPDEDDDEEEMEEMEEETTDEDDEESEEDIDALLDALMERKHRVTNRGYKYTSREKAPQPEIKARRQGGRVINWLTPAEISNTLRRFERI